MKKIVSCPFFLSIIILNYFFNPVHTLSQDDWDFDNEAKSEKLNPTFNDTRVVNGHSVELLEAKTLDLRISHRFGDIAVPSSGRSLYGLDNSTDIRIGLEYGLTEKFMFGAGRSKGAGLYREFWDGLIKYKILSQSTKIPISVKEFKKEHLSTIGFKDPQMPVFIFYRCWPFRARHHRFVKSLWRKMTSSKNRVLGFQHYTFPNF